MRLGVTVCTRNRPRMVQACVASLCREIIAVEADVFIVVVENNAEKSLTDEFEKLLEDYPTVEFIYRLEPTVGIPFARNRAIETALEHDAEWIGFVDDDEEVEPGWLAAMITASRELNADALTGPVRTVDPAEPPSWWTASRDDRRSHGQVLESAATNNALLNCDWLRRVDPLLRFNEKRRFTGGEDTEFFYRVSDRGGTIRWVSDAVVSETVPAARLTMRWHIVLKARTKANNARNYKDRKGTFAASGKYLPSAFRRCLLTLPLMAAGLVCRPFSKDHSDRLMFSGLKSAASAIGAVRGLAGWELEPYRSVEGH